MGKGLEEMSQYTSQEVSISTSWGLSKEGSYPLPQPLEFFCSLVLEKIRSAVGSTQLLLSQKVQQFFRLCQQSLVSVCEGRAGCVYPTGDPA